MDTTSNYKNRSAASLSNKWLSAAAVVLVYFLIYIVVSAFQTFGGDSTSIALIISFGVGLLMLPMVWGLKVEFLKVKRGGNPVVSGLFEGYKDFTRIFTTSILQSVYVILWSLLLIVPGIIKYYSYAMTDFVLKDDAELSNNAAIEKSMALMEGHKMDLFLLDLSFIGWFLLSLLTFGLGFLWLIPYVYTAHAHFYDDLKSSQSEEVIVKSVVE